MSIKEHKNASGIKFQVYGRTRVGGVSKKEYVGSYDSRREAEKADENHKARQRMIADGELPEAIDGKRTLGETIDAWLKHLGTLTPDDTGHRSITAYESKLRCHVPTALQTTPLSKLTSQKLETLQASLKSGSDIGSQTINAVFVALSSCLSWAKDKRWIARNPVHEIDKLKVRRKSDADNAGGFRWIRDTADVTKLLTACRMDSLRTILAVLINTGLRHDEALHLRSSDIDLENRIIHVRRGLHGTTKSGKDRAVPIFDSVIDVLRKLKLAAGKDGLLWPGQRRDKSGQPMPMTKMTVHSNFKRALKRAGLDTKIRVHDLRHTFASHYMTNGGDIFKLSRILGHSSVKITEGTYAHLSPKAHAADYGRVAFAMPTATTGKVIALRA